MRKIILHTARVDNGHTRRAAGEEVGVGAGKDQITAEIAADLVARGMAVEGPKASTKDAEAQ